MYPGSRTRELVDAFDRYAPHCVACVVGGEPGPPQAVFGPGGCFGFSADLNREGDRVGVLVTDVAARTCRHFWYDVDNAASLAVAVVRIIEAFGLHREQLDEP